MTDVQMVLPLSDERGIRLTAAELARELGQPTPTPEQTAVIEAPLGPCVVVAGAGSGKTETMAARVVWLVANDLVQPEQILGLTFTRKAARELASRIRRRLIQLAGRGLCDDDHGDVTVSTYDAYAQRVVAEHALRDGHEPSPRLLTEAMAWQYADRVVRAYDGPMDNVDRALSTVIRDVVDLHGEMSGHLVTADELREFTSDLIEQVEAKPRAGRSKEALYAGVKKALERQRARLDLLPMVERFVEEKKGREAVDFADQAALAARLARSHPEVGERERERYSVVLLDEYQDTSHSQLVMLSGLFGVDGHPVTAVGDPCQSIYGWRGASARTLDSFGFVFRTKKQEQAPTLNLTTSFRNGSAILDVANTLSGPLRQAGLLVPELHAFEGNKPGEVVASLHLTVEDEAQDIARIADKEWHRKKKERPTMAVLVRARAQIDRIAHALRAKGLPVEVVGVGGLLTTPAVSDVVATLEVLADPTRGDALMRLLTGSRWRIGPRDLDGLGRWAKHRAPKKQDGLVVEEADSSSIIDALDAIGSSPQAGFFSPEGRRRLTRFADELRGLRKRSGQGLVDLVADVVRTLRLDVEVAVRTGNVSISRADLDAFLDVVVEFTESGESPTLTAFLAYLEAAADEERGLETGQVEVDENRIQVLTVHGAKGLEWDVVFVPGLAEGVFPTQSKTSAEWLTTVGALPFPMRGDREALPVWEVSHADDQKEVDEARKAFVESCAQWARREERRLAYVAVTRARRLLVASGYRWADGKKPREISEFLAEIAGVCREGAGKVPVWVDQVDEEAGNPLTLEPPSHAWPYDPLNSDRRSEVETGAALVRRARELLSAEMVEVSARAEEAAIAGEDVGDPGSLGAGRLWRDLLASEDLTEELYDDAIKWQQDVDILLAERSRRAASTDVVVELPEHLSVSQLVLLRRDPEALAKAIRRPLPHPPNPLARRGTAFHAWLEARFGMPQLLDIDELPGAADAQAGVDEDIEALQEAFLASEWADRIPTDVEVSFELVIAGVVVRGRADAVFPAAAGSSGRGGIEVVDWKTGRPPTDPEDEAARAVQLAAYRLAWAEVTGLPLERVGAAFHYVRRNYTARPINLLDRAGLEALVLSIATE